MRNSVEDFFKFEINNRLFDYSDKQGLLPWESVRYYVGSRVIDSIPSIPPIKERGTLISKLSLFILQLLIFLKYYISHRRAENMFLLCSRDKNGDIFYDKICDGILDLSDMKKSFVIDTNWHEYNYKYKNHTCYVNFILPLLRRFYHRNYDFLPIYKLIKKRFPSLKLEISELNNWYKEFGIQFFLYRQLIRYLGVKKIFFVQNGIMKGMMAAAQSLGVELIEFQHGQISKNHLAYSYSPNMASYSLEIYHPTKLLTFGPYWSKNRYYPNVEDIVIGNNFYSSEVKQKDIICRQILVISDIFEGRKLMAFVKSVLEIDNNFKFYFKLHPNQYHELNEYISAFDSFLNVEVVADNQTVNELLSKSEAILVVQSTVELEALRVGRKVFVVKGGAYMLMDFVFNESGVYVIDSPNSFVECYSQVINVPLQPRDDLFVEFQTKTAKSLLC